MSVKEGGAFAQACTLTCLPVWLPVGGADLAALPLLLISATACWPSTFCWFSAFAATLMLADAACCVRLAELAYEAIPSIMSSVTAMMERVP